MKYNYRIQGISNTGKPNVSVHCSHCGQVDFHLQGHIYIAKLECNPRSNMEGACKEFFDRLNKVDNSLFESPKTARKIYASLCHCDPHVVDLDTKRSVLRAKAIKQAGLELLKK